MTSLTVSDDQPISDVEFRIVPFADPLVEGIFEIRAGRAPAAFGEVLLQADVARDLGVDVGDSFDLDRPSGTWTVAGIGSASDDFNRRIFAVSEFPESRFRPQLGPAARLVDLPDDVSASQLTPLVRVDFENPLFIAPDLAARTGVLQNWWAFDPDRDQVSTEAVAWGWVAGALALAAVGVIIAAAFASSARRQLTTIGHLAANGAPERLVRGTLALQGGWTGLIGSVAGISLALAALPLSRPLVERLFARRLGPWEIEPTALVVICLTGIVAATIAATFPARSAARIPVLTALAGRRPLGAVPRRLVPIGLASFAAGIGLLVLVTVAASSGGAGSDGSSDGNIYAVAAVFGGLLVLGGMCCASPISVDFIGRVGARLSGSWRLAARSIARSRTRSAGVLTAIAVTGTAAIAITTAVGSLAFGDESDVPFVPRDTVVLSSIQYDNTPPPGTSPGPDEFVAPIVDVVPLDADIAAQVRRVIPDARVTPLRIVIPDRSTDRLEPTSNHSHSRSSLPIRPPAISSACRLAMPRHSTEPDSSTFRSGMASRTVTFPRTTRPSCRLRQATSTSRSSTPRTDSHLVRGGGMGHHRATRRRTRARRRRCRPRVPGSRRTHQEPAGRTR